MTPIQKLILLAAPLAFCQSHTLMAHYEEELVFASGLRFEHLPISQMSLLEKEDAGPVSLSKGQVTVYRYNEPVSAILQKIQNIYNKVDVDSQLFVEVLTILKSEHKKVPFPYLIRGPLSVPTMAEYFGYNIGLLTPTKCATALCLYPTFPSRIWLMRVKDDLWYGMSTKGPLTLSIEDWAFEQRNEILEFASDLQKSPSPEVPELAIKAKNIQKRALKGDLNTWRLYAFDPLANRSSTVPKVIKWDIDISEYKRSVFENHTTVPHIIDKPMPETYETVPETCETVLETELKIDLIGEKNSNWNSFLEGF